MKKWKQCFAVRKTSMDLDFALLFLRLFVGYAFMVHGWGKIQNPMGWMGPDSAIPGVFLFLAAFSEFAGGLALILGLLTRLASLGLFFTMLVASSYHLFVAGDSLIHTGAGNAAESAVIYLLVSLLFVIQGPGRHSVDRMVFGLAK